MTARPLDVLWAAPADRPPALPADVATRLRVRFVTPPLPPGGAEADLAVLDLRAFPTPREAFDARLGLDAPVLYLAGPGDLAAVLPRLFECDDLDLHDVPGRLLAHRAEGLWRRWATEQEAFVSPLRDLLTGLSNLRDFQHSLGSVLRSAKPAAPVSLVWVDLYRFGRVNQEHGRVAGDVVLQHLAVRLRALAQDRGLARAARVEGDQFALLLHQSPATEAREVAERVVTAIGRVRFRLGPGQPSVRTSACAGVATAPEPGPVDELVRRAREALAGAKGRGSGAVVSYGDLGRAPTRTQAEEAGDLLEDLIQSLTRRVTDELAAMGRKLLDQVGQAADRDGLTQLLNRGFLERRSTQNLCAVGVSRPLAVALLDVDHFHDVNDGHGWTTGDGVLKAIAHVLRENLRAGDWAVRYGGEEFLLVLDDATAEVAGPILERVRQQVEAQEFADPKGRTFRVTVSIGVTVDHPGDQRLKELIERASQHLLLAKHEGRNRVVGDPPGTAGEDGGTSAPPLGRADS